MAVFGIVVGNWKAPLAARREQRRLAEGYLGTELRVRTMKQPTGGSPVEDRKSVV